MPTTGIKAVTIAILIQLQTPNEKVMPAVAKRVKLSWLEELKVKHLDTMAKHIEIRKKQPIKPNSSAHRAKIKSVLCSGRN